jgi:AP-1 complex subunit gamma-1
MYSSDLLYSYVALNTLNKVALSDNAVQRHRDVVLSCLSDGDVSIRRRALELSYALINEQNIRIMMRELLAFLEVADNEFKSGLTTQISLAAERFAPNKRWHIDTVLRTLTLVSRSAGRADMFWLSSLPDRLATTFAKRSYLASYGLSVIQPNFRHTRHNVFTKPCVRIYRRNPWRWQPFGF